LIRQDTLRFRINESIVHRPVNVFTENQAIAPPFLESIFPDIPDEQAIPRFAVAQLSPMD